MSSDERSESRAGADVSKRAGIALLVLGLLTLLGGGALWWPRTVDDAFITYRYAQNLVAGEGPVFNPGERVEGYTSPSWLLLSAGAIAAGVDPVLVSKLGGLFSSLLLILLLFVTLRRSSVPHWGAGLAALLLGSSVVLQIWSTSGMETNAYALLFFAGLSALAVDRCSCRWTVLSSLLLVAATLTRPEGLAYWGLGLVVTLASPPAAEEPAPRRRLRTAAVYLLPGLLLVAHLSWRLAYYGQLLPNTYYAKTGGGAEMWAQGLDGLKGFLLHPAHLPWILAAVAGAAIGLVTARRCRAVAILGSATLLHLLYVVSVGDDGLAVHRFYVAVLAPLAFLVGLLFTDPGQRGELHRRLRPIGVLAVGLTAVLSLLTLTTRLLPALNAGMLPYQEGNVRLGKHLASTRAPDTLVAVASAGAIPFYSGLPCIDMYGLNDAHIARKPFPERRHGPLMKWDNAYVLSRRPDLIVINRGYFRAGVRLADIVQLRPGLMAVSPMDRDLFASVTRDGSYTLRRIRFEDGAVFFVFERASSQPD